MSDNPSISVIMPTYNSSKFLKRSIQSILNQSFTDFEFIIVNDGSIDNSQEIINNFQDNRITSISNIKNLGNYCSRNQGFLIAKGEFICIMDADDIAEPYRLERQFGFMNRNSQFGLAGSGFRYCGSKRDLFRENNYEKIKVILLRNNCFIHPTLIIRRDLINKHKLQYNEDFYYSADYDLIVRAARCFPITNIPEVLLNYRIHNDQITVKYRHNQMKYAEEIALCQIKQLDILPSQSEINIHNCLLKGDIIDYSKRQELEDWINKVLRANRETNFYLNNELKSFFDALLSIQPFCKRVTKINYIKLPNEKNKMNLLDFTFLLRLRIDSETRIENTNSVIRFINKYFNTNILVLEADQKQRYFPPKFLPNFQYVFCKDNQEYFHKTKWANKMMSIIKTSFIAIWDVDSIAPPEQIINSVEELRKGNTIMCYPYDGKFYSCDKNSSEIFMRFLDHKFLIKQIPSMRLMHGYHSVGGAFLVNRAVYLSCGGENENIFSWGIEDAERNKRMEVLNFPIFRSNGPLFHLWHPLGKNSRFANITIEKQNRNELLNICKMRINSTEV